MSDPLPIHASLVQTIAALRSVLDEKRSLKKTIGFVPTMGALHAGHARLIETAAQHTQTVVVSIFVNPTQFGPHEDFDRYPRTLEADLEVCSRAGASLVFAPDATQVYPTGPNATGVEVPHLGDVLCGAHRPGHFKGVATVVLKLLNIVSPDIAFFGEKDFQQLAIIRRMVADLNVPVEIRGVATVREPDGLALSSRNRYLSPADRRVAPVLWQALQAAATAARRGEDEPDAIRQILRATLESHSRVKLQYAEVVDAETLRSPRRFEPQREARALVAAYLGSTRLIDNIALPRAEA